MIILGIDPGLAETGVGIIEKTKNSKNGSKFIYLYCLKTKNSLDKEKRLKIIHDEVVGLIKKFKAEVMAIEGLFFFRNAKSVSSVGQSIGAIMVAAADCGIKVIEYSPLKIKKNLTNYGRAEKKDLQSAVRKHLGIRKIPRPTHAADALAVAICHAMNSK